MNGAVVGLGGQGRRHAHAMKAIGIDVVAICDKNPQALSAQLEPWQYDYPQSLELGSTLHRFYVDWEEMLGEEAIDVLSVATTTSEHAPIVIKAAKSDVRYILCEKPMADSLAAAEEMIRVCREQDVFLSINHTRRWWKEHNDMRSIIHAGRIGDLRHLWVSCGGARLGDLALHFIDWMRWIARSEVLSVTGWLDKITEPNPRGQQFQDPPGSLVLVFQNGVRGVIDLSEGVALPPRFEVVGTRGRILIEECGGAHDRWEVDARPEENLVATTDYYGKLERMPFFPSGVIEWQVMVERALENLVEGRATCTGEDGYRALEALVAAHLSHQRGNVPVELPLTKQAELTFTLPIA